MSASEPPRPTAAAGGEGDDELALGEVCPLDNTGIVAVAGPLDEVAEQAHRSILHALADDFSAVLCDLSGVTGFPAPEATALLASVGSEVRQWPGTPVGLVCPAVRLRQSLGRHPDSRYLVLAERRRQALAALARQPRATIVRASLPPVARSARAARDLVARTLLDWGWGPQIGSATLVVSELVTHAMLDADSELWVTISRCGSQLRLAVRDTNRTTYPASRGRTLRALTHRGLMLVAAVSESWGVLPTSGGGKVVWAVLAANPSSARAARPPGGRCGAVGAVARSRRTPRPRPGRYPRPP